MSEAAIDPRFAAAHYMDGRDLIYPQPCPWIRDLDDTLSEQGQQYVAHIRQNCQCEECTQLREKST